VQLWLELDFLLNNVDGEDLLPAHLIALLPPPPPAGWPTNFCVNMAHQRLCQLYDVAVQQAQGLSESERAKRAWAFVPADPKYPTRLRAARLSWLIWGVIGTQTVGAQILKSTL
jgi:hypothetical protein